MAASQRKEKLAESGDNLRNIVREYHELLEQEFGDERRHDVKDEFARFAADPALEIVEDIRTMEGVAREERYAAIAKIFEAVTRALEELAKPELSRQLWRDRPADQRSADPFRWVAEHYPSYGRNLTQADVRGHDLPLYRNLHRLKSTTGWPDWFDLPAKKDVHARALAETPSPESLAGTDRLPPDARAKRRSLRNASQYRQRNS